jgi:type IV secretory pathway VirB3-like protein
MWFWVLRYILIMVMLFIVIQLFIVHDKNMVLTRTWRTTQENSATTRVVWDALG